MPIAAKGAEVRSALLHQLLAPRKPGDTMHITLSRPPRETKTITVTLGELAAS